MDGTVRNPQLHDTLRQWLIRALPELNSDGRIQNRASDPQYAAILIFRTPSRFSELSETQALAETISQIPEFIYQSESAIPANDEGADSNNWQARSVIADFALQYFLQAPSHEIEPELFASLYSELETYLYRFDSIRIRMIIELWNVTSEITPIELPSGVIIRQLSADEQAQSRNATQNSFPYLPGTDDPQIPTPDLLIEFDRSATEWALVDAPKHLVMRLGSFGQGRTIGDRLLQSLRLLQNNEVRLGRGWTFPGNRFLRPDSEFGGGRESFPISSFYDPYSRGQEARSDTSAHLTRDQVERLANVYSFVESKSDVRQKLEVPLRRFAMSFNRIAPVERFIDHWTALEALFSPGFQESSYRMHQFMAQFVGHDPRDRWDIYSKAKLAYTARNHVLHGRRFLSTEELHRHAAPIEDYVRRSLIKCIEDERMPDHGELEREIFLQGASADPE
jgi:hypothetical protein